MDGAILSQIKIGELDYTKEERDGCVILTPFFRCYVITTAGQIWDIEAFAFTCSEDSLAEAWADEAVRYEHFKQREYA